MLPDDRFPEYVPAAERRAEEERQRIGQAEERISVLLSAANEARDRLLAVRERIMSGIPMERGRYLPIDAGVWRRVPEARAANRTSSADTRALRPVEVTTHEGVHLEAAWVLRMKYEVDLHNWKDADIRYATYVLFQDGRLAFSSDHWRYLDVVEVPEELIAQQARLLSERPDIFSVEWEGIIDSFKLSADSLRNYLEKEVIPSGSKDFLEANQTDDSEP